MVAETEVGTLHNSRWAGAGRVVWRIRVVGLTEIGSGLAVWMREGRGVFARFPNPWLQVDSRSVHAAWMDGWMDGWKEEEG